MIQFLKGKRDLDQISEKIAYCSSLTQADCHAVIISMVSAVAQELEEGKIVRLGHLGAFQISVKGSGSATAEAVAPQNVKSASVIFRPGKKFKAMLKDLKFVKKSV